MTLSCPVCPTGITVSDADPDASLDAFWSHLLRHPTASARVRELMFVQAQKNAQERS